MQYRYIIAERFTYHFVIAVWRAKSKRLPCEKLSGELDYVGQRQRRS
jgi:hypothetical protein